MQLEEMKLYLDQMPVVFAKLSEAKNFQALGGMPTDEFITKYKVGQIYLYKDWEEKLIFEVIEHCIEHCIEYFKIRVIFSEFLPNKSEHRRLFLTIDKLSPFSKAILLNDLTKDYEKYSRFELIEM